MGNIHQRRKIALWNSYSYLNNEKYYPIYRLLLKYKNLLKKKTKHFFIQMKTQKSKKKL